MCTLKNRVLNQFVFFSSNLWTALSFSTFNAPVNWLYTATSRLTLSVPSHKLSLTIPLVCDGLMRCVLLTRTWHNQWIKHRILNTQTTRSVHAEYNLVTTYENHQFMEPMSPVEIILPQNAEPNARIQKMKLFGLFLGMGHTVCYAA